MPAVNKSFFVIAAIVVCAVIVIFAVVKQVKEPSVYADNNQDQTVAKPLTTAEYQGKVLEILQPLTAQAASLEQLTAARDNLATLLVSSEDKDFHLRLFVVFDTWRLDAEAATTTRYAQISQRFTDLAQSTPWLKDSLSAITAVNFSQ